MEKKINQAIIIAGILLTTAFLGIQWFLKSGGRDLSANQIESRLEFGATYMTMNNPFFEIIDDEIRSVVEGHGDVLITRDPALHQDKQIEQIYELIDRRVAAIFLNPVDWKGVKPALEAAKEAGIPVIAVDAPVYDSDLVTCTVVSDNYDAGVQCGQHLLENHQGGSIVLLEHPGAKSAQDRIQGFLDTIEGDPRFQIVGREACEGQLELAMPAMERQLAKNPRINIVMALNDPSAMGAMAALEDYGRLDRVSVYGVDGSPEAKSMITEGNMTATSSQFPNRIGQIAVEQAYQIIGGTWSGEEKEIQVPVSLITRQNVEEYGTDGWK